MKVKNTIKTIMLGGLLYSATSIQADQEYAKVLFDAPEANLTMCAHYIIEDNRLLKIFLYEANIDNIKNNLPVGYIICDIKKFTNDGPAYIEVLYIYPENRKRNYGRIIAHLALQELANLGFTHVLFTPGQIDTVKQSTLQQLYTAGGAKPTTKSHYTDYLPTSLERGTPSYREKLATAKEKQRQKWYMTFQIMK